MSGNEWLAWAEIGRRLDVYRRLVEGGMTEDEALYRAAMGSDNETEGKTK